MNPPVLTAFQARLLLDHLDNQKAVALPDHAYREYVQAKWKLTGFIAADREAA